MTLYSFALLARNSLGRVFGASGSMDLRSLV